MLNVLLLSMAFLADDVSFVGLGERKIIQLVTTRDETLLRAVKGVENGKLAVTNISTLEEQKFEKSQLKAIRTNVSDRSIAEGLGIGPWVAWQLLPIFEGASKR